jgi:hypothetical protein
MTIATASPPEQGQLVSVRQRRYVLNEVGRLRQPAALGQDDNRILIKIE